MSSLRAIALVTCFTLAGAAVGGSSTGSSSSYATPEQIEWCAKKPLKELYKRPQYQEADGSVRIDKVFNDCKLVCPQTSTPDHRDTCVTGHAFHMAYPTYSENTTYHGTLQWKVGFLILSILVGAFYRSVNPSWMPYTVSLLIFFIILGMIAGLRASAIDCPSSAYLLSSGGHVTQDSWKVFTGTHENIPISSGSFCADKTCGDGTADPKTCRWKFSDLDVKFKLAGMHPEKVNAGAGDGVLSADELWTFDCNFLRDLLSLADIDPHVLLVVFLPSLLFESACFGIDMGIFKKQLSQIVIMAFPGMILASVVTGLLVWAAIPDWTFWVCWLIGIISSATDPVAVVALLKDLGAPKTLGTLIEGESLMNDGSAVVLFVWVRNAIGYTYSTAPPEWMEGDGKRYTGEVASEFFRVVAQMLIYGLFFGALWGKVLHLMLRRVYNDKYIEGSLVIGMTYFAFWFSELFMGTSAVLAVVIMGLYINYFKSCISPEVLHFLHLFYEMCAHVLNTIIFAIAGSKLGLLLVDNSLQANLSSFPGGGRIFAIYPIILFARGFSIAFFYPVLSRLGTGCTWQEAVIMWWGGLRGSVGLALALALLHTVYDPTMWGSGGKMKYYEWDGIKMAYPSLDCRDQPFTVVLMTLFVVSFTVIINGLTMAPLMKLLKMTDVPFDRKFMLNGAHERLAKITNNYMTDLAEKAEFGGVDWDTVGTKLLQQQTFEVEPEHEERCAWLAVVNMERANFLAQFEKGILSSDAFQTLETFYADLAAKAAHVDSDDLGKIYDEEFNKLISDLSAEKAAHSPVPYEVAIAYLAANAEVAHITREISARSTRIFTKVAEEHEDNLHKMKAELDAYVAPQPKARKTRISITPVIQSADHQAIKQARAVFLVLLKQRETIEHMQHEGELTDLDAVPMINAINKMIGSQYSTSVRCLKQPESEGEPNAVVPDTVGLKETE